MTLPLNTIDVELAPDSYLARVSLDFEALYFHVFNLHKDMGHGSHMWRDCETGSENTRTARM
jgi:hypothetical protein